MKNSKTEAWAVALLALLSLSSCEKMVIDEEENLQDTDANVIIRTSLYNIVPFDTRAVENIEDVCSHLCIAFFQNDTKVKDVRQASGDEGYGEVAVTLEPGTYQLLVLAHSSQGNPTITDPTAIQFTNSLTYSDTFCYYGDLEVTNTTATHEIKLKRATTLLRLNLTDDKPSNVKYIRIEYTGGSGVLNTVTGRGGTVNSKQIVLFDVADKNPIPALYLYTFLQSETASLNVTIQAKDDSYVLTEKTLSNVPMKEYMMTEYTGSLFSNSSEDTFSFTAETGWEVYHQGGF